MAAVRPPPPPLPLRQPRACARRARKEKSKKKKAEAESSDETSEESTAAADKTANQAEKGERDERSAKDEKEAKEEKSVTDGTKAKNANAADKKEKTGNKSEKTGEPNKAEAVPDKKDAPKLLAPEKSLASEAVWADLMQGNKRFIAGQHTLGKLIAARAELAGGQQPHVIILGCADSRVPPELLFDKNLGELFVVRAAGNVADSVALGSIEYAVTELHAGVLVVLGHENCGAVAAAVSGEKMPSKNLASIVSKIAPAFAAADSCPLGGKLNSSCIQLNVRQSAKDVLLNSPLLKAAVKEGKLTLIRAVYKLDTGEVVRLDE